ncbi:alpha glucosidase [Silvimonas sp.]|uniref:alpha-glucosidase n=1 Tax=Silvimonas sp. TaxID=2650811 RepID=UPI00284B738C|nr:alpha glucosidase [Silvimonas sp.]MDR3426844.1 alpha glucosidase [Silvimonas sp.]
MAKQSKAWWRGAVIYQIYPRSFMDSNGDGVGDLPGIRQHVPYLKRLNVDAVWISPFFKSPMKDFGYDVADYREVDPLFGTLADFDALVADLHKAGLRVIIDQVLSHSADVHPWFEESRQSRDNPKADWYVWADAKSDGTPPSNWLSVFGGSAWQWDAQRRQYYLHNFLVSQPDLNFHCEDVQQATLDNIEFWLKRGVDGFRFDACNYHFHDRKLRSNPPAAVVDDITVTAANPYGMQQHLYDKSRPQNLKFLKRLRKLLDQYGAASVGEVGDDDSLTRMAEYTSGGDKLNQAYSFNLLTEHYSAEFIRGQVLAMEHHLANYDKPGWVCWSVGNHDVPRVLTRWGHNVADPQFSRMVLALLTTLRGSSCIYQGDELGLPEADIPFDLLQDPYGKAFWPQFKGRDGCRAPMPWKKHAANAGFTVGTPWLPIPEEHKAHAATVQERPLDSVLNFTRHFLAWRRHYPALIRGDIKFYKAPEPVLLFTRKLDDTTILVALNLGDAEMRVTLPGTLHNVIPLSGHGLGRGLIDDGVIDLGAFGGSFATVR